MSKFYNFYLTTVLLTVSIFSLLTLDFANADNNKVVAMVNGVAIKEDALTVEVNKKLPLTSYHTRISEQKLQKFRSQALQKLIEEELLYQEAKRQKLVIKPSELELQITTMKIGYPSETAFQHALAKSGLNMQSLMERLQRRLLIKKCQQKEILNKVTVTDSDLREYFEANKAKFIVPKRFRVRHILISVDPGAMATGWQAGLEEAEQVYSHIVAGENFARLAKEFSADSSSRELGGDHGWLHVGQLIPELDEAIREMKIGEVSKPIRSIYGFHILKLEDEQPGKQLTFDEINHEGLKQRLMKKRIETRRQEYLSHLRAQSDIRIFEF